MVEQKLLERIAFDPKIFGGKPIVRDRRLAVEHVLGMLAAGDSTGRWDAIYGSSGKTFRLALTTRADQCAHRVAARRVGRLKDFGSLAVFGGRRHAGIIRLAGIPARAGAGWYFLRLSSSPPSAPAAAQSVKQDASHRYSLGGEE